MPQSDLNIENQQMPSGRVDVNGALAALATLQSGPTQPASPQAGWFWWDTSTGNINQRNSANNNWVLVGTFGASRWGNAPLNAPTFTGVAQCTNTASATASDLQIANMAAVQAAIKTGHGAWQTPSLLNSWTANATVQYRIMSDNNLQIKGAVTNAGTVGTSSQIFILPAGFRPIQTHQPKIRYSGSTLYVLQIQADGQVLHTATGNLTGIFQDFDIVIPLT